MFILVISISQQSFIAISLVSVKLLQIFGTVFGYKSFRLNFEGLFGARMRPENATDARLCGSAPVDHELPFSKWGYNRKSE